MPFILLFSILLLGMLVFTIAQNNEKRKELIPNTVGQQVVALLKIYDEGEKINFFMAMAGKLAQQKTEQQLMLNGGYASTTTCEKLTDVQTKTDWVIWSKKCEPFNPEQAYLKELGTQLTQFTNGYQSQYTPFPDQDPAWKAVLKYFQGKKVGKDLVAEYSKRVQTTTIEKVQSTNKETTLSVKTISLPLEAADGEYQVKPNVPLNQIQTAPYLQAYTTAVTCQATKDPKTECLPLFQKISPDARVNLQGETIQVTLPKIRFMFSVKEDLPPLANLQ